MTAQRKIFLIVSGFAAFIACSGAIVASSKTEIEGVPRRLLPQYKAKVNQVLVDAAYAKMIGQQIHPQAFVLKKKFDFGLLDPETTASHDFYVENQGKAPLVLELVNTTCKCTVGKVGDREILPGGAGKVTLTWNTGLKAERYEQTARIKTNDPLNPTLDLTVSGEIRAELKMPEAISFGSLNPGKAESAKFIVYSQVWNDFELTEVNCELPGFYWDVHPIVSTHPKLRDLDYKSAWEIEFSTTGGNRGHFEGEAELVFVGSDPQQPIRRKVSLSGKVRAPINFYGPELHAEKGLEIGVLTNNQSHEFPMVVRLRGPQIHPIRVLKVKPEGLSARLEPIDEHQYRLVLEIPKDCPQVQFNRKDLHGYIEVGDPNDKSYSNWLPVYGAVVSP
jgi:Protein of unknown function (DUF1573)